MFLGYDPQRIGLQTEWLIEFIKMHKRNHPDAKFKIGDKVLYSNLDIVPRPITCNILAVNVQEKDVVEYAITNVYGSLVWEEELKEVKE